MVNVLGLAGSVNTVQVERLHQNDPFTDTSTSLEWLKSSQTLPIVQLYYRGKKVVYIMNFELPYQNSGNRWLITI